MKSTLSKNTIGEVYFNKFATGQYHCTSDGLFSIARTEVKIQSCDGTSSPALGMFFAHVLDENTILIYSTNVTSDDCVDADFRHLDFSINI